MIPKIIHYCWFGGNEKSDIIKQCIESWKKFCPDYEIIEWNESNFDVNCNQYVKDAYAAKKWAFVSDYARYNIIYNNGGIYLDTDVELLKSLDEYLDYDLWLPRETQRTFATGLGFAAKPKHCLIKKLYEVRENLKFDLTVNTNIDTPIIFEDLKLDYSSKSLIINNQLIMNEHEYYKTAFHHGTRTWMDDNDKKFIKRREEKHKLLKKLLRNNTILNYIHKHKNCKILKLYFFISYDFLDYGFVYYTKLIFKKIFK